MCTLNHLCCKKTSSTIHVIAYDMLPQQVPKHVRYDFLPCIIFLDMQNVVHIINVLIETLSPETQNVSTCSRFVSTMRVFNTTTTTTTNDIGTIAVGEYNEEEQTIT